MFCRGFRVVEKAGSMLSPYRVLDLTDEKGFLADKISADPGAESARNGGKNIASSSNMPPR